MMKSYVELVKQTFDFPCREFTLTEYTLKFHGVPLMELIQRYGTPLKLTYLPSIRKNIQYIKGCFNNAFKKLHYPAQYIYCYCTKANHFAFVLEEALSNDIHLELSSTFDTGIVRYLYHKQKMDKNQYIICNGCKPVSYMQAIVDLIQAGFHRCIPILDDREELRYYQERLKEPFKVGIRLAADEEPNFSFYTSRLGMRYSDVVEYYKENILSHPHTQLKMLHFFVHTGINDSAYYWSELSRFIQKYCELKKMAPELDSINIGGGLPIKSSLGFDFDYTYMIEQIVKNIQWACKKNQVDPPHVFTEFGSYTVGESSAVLYKVIREKWQNDVEAWYMVDGSFITQLPDIWGLNKKFILLPINQWKQPYHRVVLGGLTCDSQDYYDAEAHHSEVFLPEISDKEPLYLGFFHTGAYQESIGGYGGVQHCLIPAPKHIVISEEKNGTKIYKEFAPEQSQEGMLAHLGYQ